MNRSAKFLVLTDTHSNRALLFDVDQRLLGEVIEDDGYIVDRLLSGATPCSLPDLGMLQSVKPAAAATQPARCYELG